MGKKGLQEQIISIFSAFLVVFQSIAPSLAFLPTAVYAQEDSSSSAVVETSPAPTEEPTPTLEPSPTEVTPIPTEKPTPTLEPSLEVTATPVPTDEPTPTSEPEVSVTPQPTPNESPIPPPTGDVEQGSLTAVVVENTSAESVESLDLDPVEATSAQLVTDKADYAPTDTAVISGTGLTPNTTYILVISSEDEPPVTHTENVTTDENGGFVYAYQLDGIYRPNYTVVLKDQAGNVVAQTSFTDANPSADLDQCANDPAPSPSTDGCNASASDWVNGNLGASKSSYIEGDSIPYRLVFGSLSTSGSHTVTIEWDTTKSDKHAIDYITTFNRTVTTANPCLGVSGCSSSTTFAIPKDPQVDNGSGSPITQEAGNLTMYGGTITSVSAYSYPNGSGFTGDKSSRITITFTASVANPVLAWGGHIATRQNWGQNNSAIFISGSPYHTRLIDLDGSGGNQDRSLSAEAVIFPASVTIVKDAVPDNAQDFSFTGTLGTAILDDDSNTTNSNQAVFSVTDFSGQNNSASKTITEGAVSGWALTGLVCTENGTQDSTVNLETRTATINVQEGDTASCTFTNTLQQAHLTLVKTVTNDNGGGAVATDWTLSATGPTSIFGTTGSGAVTNAAVNSGTYTLSESGGPAGYTASAWTCDGATVTGGNTITLAPNDNATCTINNNDNAPTLTLVKTVTNNNGGSATTANFQGKIDGNDVPWGAAQTLSAGAHTASETTLSGYTASSWGGDCAADGTITLALGENKTCTITNDDQQAYIIVDKTVINDNGGSAAADDFLLTVDGNAVLDGVAYAVNPGTHTAGETNLSGYTAGDFGGDCSAQGSVTVALGETKTCTITNNDDAPSLTLVKVVDNGNGGNAVASDWTLEAVGIGVTGFVGIGPSVSSGPTFSAGTYDLSEVGPSGYTASAWVCVGGSQTDGDTVVLGLGENVTCTITNDDITPTITLIKNVTADHGGSALPDDFDLTIDGSIVGSGTTNPVSANVDHVINETDLEGYEFVSITGEGCPTELGGSVNLDEGESITCTITNDDQPAEIHGMKFEDHDGDGVKDEGDQGLSGWTIFLDANDNGEKDTGETSTVTVADGAYSFTGLSVGTYKVREVTQAGWTQTTSNPADVVLTNGQVVNDVNFGNFELITISAKKFNDLNGDHVRTDGTSDPNLPGWTIRLDKDGTSSPPSCSGGSVNGEFCEKSTNSSGNVSFTGLGPGTYIVSEVLQAGWIQTRPNESFGGTGAQADGTYILTLSSGDNPPERQFGNFKLGEIHGVKFNDVNGNGVKNEGDNGLEGWTVYLDTNDNGSKDDGEVSATTASDGTYSFIGLTVGTYHVREVGQNGWTQTAPNGGKYDVAVQSGTNAEDKDFGNFQLGKISGAKFNDLNGDGTWDDLEPALANWTINLSGPINASTTTNSDGNYEFTGLTAGSYTVTETQQTGWTQTTSNPASINVQSGANSQNNIFGNFKNVKIKVFKYEDMDGDGVKDPEDLPIEGWEMTLNDGQAQDTNADGMVEWTVTEGGEYVVIEEDQEGWTHTSDATETVFVQSGDQDHVVTFLNFENPKLTVIKHVINDHSGPLGAGDFTVHVASDSGDVLGSPQSGSEIGTVYTLTPGDYVVSEDEPPFGYAMSGVSGDCDEDGNVNMISGDEKTCTITNDDIAPKLTITKHVVNDNGGTSSAENFTMNVAGTEVSDSSFPGAESPGTTVTLDEGPYSVTEEGPAGYSESDSADCSGSIGVGEEKTCTITNNDDEPSLTLVKVVKNDDGGTAVESAWTLTATGPTGFSGAGPSVSNDPSFDQGSYDLSEVGPSGYTASAWVCVGGSQTDGDTVVIGLGEDVTCTITNDDVAPTLKLVKEVTNNNGGNEVADDWVLTATGDGGFSSLGGSGIFETVLANEGYDLSESTIAGYTASGWSCDGGSLVGSTITLDVDQDVTCTIKNDDVAPTITLNKVVNNNHGGQLGSSDFELNLDGNEVTQGFANAVTANTPHDIEENPVFGYEFVSITGDDKCPEVLGGDVTLDEGENIICTITNQDIAPRLTVIKHVINNNGGNASADDFTMNVAGTNVSDPSFPGAENPGTTVTLDQGAYSVDEDQFEGYAKAIGEGCSGTINVGDEKVCTITNDDIAPQIILTKNVINDNGGTAAPDDFDLTIDTTVVGSGTTNPVSANTAHSINETVLTGYSFISITGDEKCPEVLDGTVTLDEGEVIGCTITNNDDEPSLTLVKVVKNDDGGTAVESAWTLTATGPTGFSGLGPSVNNGASFDQGTYNLSESGPAGYTGSSWVCVGGNQTDADTVEIGLGDDVTCTITNDDIAPTLKLVKEVTNDNGGAAVAGDWNLTATGNPGTFTDSGDSTTFHTVKAGVGYTLSESEVFGYSAGSWSCNADGVLAGNVVTLGINQNVTCTITNDDIQPKLTVIKHVVNDNGGNASAPNFTMTVLGVGATPALFGGEEGGTTINLNAGEYTVGEFEISGYSMSASANCSGSIDIGQTKTCTITNDDQPAHLQLTKVVVNDDGGNAAPDDFDLTIDGGIILSGSTTDVDSNTAHTINETLVDGYTFVSITGDAKCPQVLGGSVTLDEGETVSCTITNNDIAPQIVLTKNVINNNGGTAVPDDFDLTIDDVVVGSGTTNPVSANTAHSIDETILPGYEFVSIAGDVKCPQVLAGTVTLNEGEIISCTITNDDLVPSLTLVKHVTNDNGGTAVPGNWFLTADGPTGIGGSGPSVSSGSTFSAGVYTLSENGPSGYSASDWSCTGGQQNGNQVTIGLGEDVTCEITNDDDAPSLTLVKEVVNDHGGIALASDWTLTATGPTDISGVGPTVVSNSSFDQGTYTMSESGPSGYSASGWDCDGGTQNGDQITLGLGESAVCTITNDDIQPQLVVIKHVINDHNGPLNAPDFIMTVLGVGVSNPIFPGDESGTVVYLNAGEYSVGEIDVPTYTMSSSADCSGSINIGEVKTCTITNDDQPAHLTVNKILIGPIYLPKDPGSFDLLVDGNVEESGIVDIHERFEPSDPFDEGVDGATESITVDAGTHIISEQGTAGTDTNLDNYQHETFCQDGLGNPVTITPVNPPDPFLGPKPPWSVNLTNGQNVTCTIRNFPLGTPQSANQLIIVKHSIGGDDTFYYNGSSFIPNTLFDDPATFTIDGIDGIPGVTTINGTNTIDLGDGEISFDATTILSFPGFPAAVTVTEQTPPAGWVFTSLNCQAVIYDSEGQKIPVSRPISYSGQTANITFEHGDEVTCTYTNTKLGSIKIVKDADPNDLQDFNFASDLGSFTLDDDEGAFLGDTTHSNSQMFENLQPGQYSFSETLPNQYWTFKSVSCVDESGVPYEGIQQSGTGVTVNLGAGDEVTCTFLNEKESPTRTQGFWQTHTSFTSSVFSAQFPGGMFIGVNQPVGVGTHKGIIFNTQISGQSQLFGAYYASISQKSTKGKGAKRSQIDQARMQLLQQLVTAKLNCAAFGCTSAVQSMIATADTNYAGNNRNAILTSAGALDAYNNSGDTIIFSPPLPAPGNATPQISKNIANITFWDNP